MAKRILEIPKQFGGWIPANDDVFPIEGLADQYSTSTVINPFRRNFIGHIAPGQVMDILTDSGSRVNDMPIDLVSTSLSGTSVLILCENSRIVVPNAGVTTISDSRDISHGTITGIIGESILNYNDGTDEFVLYSFRGTEAWDIGRFRTTNRTYDDDFMITIPTQSNDSGRSARTANATKPGKLWIGSDKIIYRTNGQYIAAFDPNVTPNTINYAALNLGSGWIATAGLAYQNFNLIIGYKNTQATGTAGIEKGEARLWLWDGFSPEYNFHFDLNDFITGGALNIGGLVYIFTQGKNDKTKVKVFNGSSAQTVFEYISDTLGDVPQVGSIDEYDGTLYWSTPPSSGTGKILALYPLGNGRYGLHYVTHPDETSGTTTLVQDSATNSPLLKLQQDGRLLAGSNIGGTHKVLLATNVGTAFYVNAEWSSRLITLQHRSTITKIKLYFSQFGTGASVRVSLFKDYDAISVGGADDLLDKTITRAGEGDIGYISIPCYIPNINSFHMTIRFDHAAITNTAAIIRKIEIEYEENTSGF